MSRLSNSAARDVTAMAIERKLLVKAFGADLSFAVLRRRMAMGCERMQTPEGDKCGSHFPCLTDTDGPDGNQS